MSAAEQSGIRDRVRAERSLRPAADRTAACAAMTRRFVSLPETASAQCVALFASLPTEPDTWATIESLRDRGRTVLLPRIAGDRTLEWGAYDGPGSVRPGTWGILEPTPPTDHSLAEADLIVVPAIAVDPRTGVRIGYGGGYFDTTLGGIAPLAAGGPARVALCFDTELLDELPANAWDARVDIIVTPTREIRI